MLPKVVSKNRTRIVIADDHTVLRESLAALLATQPDFVVEGRASNGQEALAIVKEQPAGRVAAGSLHAGRRWL